VIVRSAERSDAGAEGSDAGVEQVADRRPPPPPDRPGQEPEGVPSRLDARRAAAAAEEQADDEPATDLPEPASDRDTEASATSAAGEDDRPAPDPPDAPAGRVPLERTDQPYEVESPQIVRDYYTNIPPTEQDRYLTRDQSDPIPLFDGPPTRDQVVQNDIGDCGIVATLGAVAAHRPDAIRDAIEQVGDGEYEITLHEITEATPAEPVARPTGDVKTYRLNDELAVRTDDASQPLVGVGADSCGWAALLEKVIAAEDQTWDTSKRGDWDQAWTTQHKFAVDQDRANAGLDPSPHESPMGYNRLDIGSTAYQRADLLTKLTGEEAEVRHVPDERQGRQALLDEFQDRLSAGKPVLVGTRGRLPGERLPDGIIGGHAYEVTKVENSQIHIRNPWGTLHPAPMDASTFWEYYREYHHDGSRHGHYATLK
jgi:hypothetical protein